MTRLAPGCSARRSAGDGEADKALTEILSRLDHGTYVVPSKQTFGDYLALFLKTAEREVRPTTFSTYKSLVEKTIVPALGTVHLQDLTAAHLDAFYAELLTSGRRIGKGGLSPATVRYVHSVIRKALKGAVRQNLLTRNVAEAATPPRVPRSQIKTWSAREVRRFLDHVIADGLYAAWVLSCTTGMRRGEVLGLRWQDVDLDAGRVSVVRSLTVVDGYKMHVSEPKTAKGRRSVALDATTLESLREHQRRQAVERALMGDAYEDEDLLFCQPDGTPVHPDSFSDAFWRHSKSATLPRIRFHDLRHTHATLALAAGVHPKVVSERLGHASITITLDTYSHAIPAMQETAAALIASLVFYEGDSDANS